jgi:nicotinic acid phosphoribosyltransferase
MRRRLAAKRKQMWKALLRAFYLLSGMPLAFDTYKRTMGEADDRFALEFAGYSLTPRKALADCDQLIMAGHEVIQAQWFFEPLLRANLELARYHCRNLSAVKAFPDKLVDKLLAEQPGKRVRLPVTIWGFPGGQAFPVLADKPKVPILSYEGLGGLVSMLEPAQCRYSTPIIQATLARLMKQTTPHDAEFGMRAAPDEINSIALLIARYIGSGGTARLTSNDQAEFMFPHLFRSIGTMGHELMCCHQEEDQKSLAQAEFEAMDNFVERMQSGMVLTDLVDSETIGLLNAIKVLAKHPTATKAGIRLDSGDIPGQCVLYYGAMKYVLHISGRTIVFENEVTHQMARDVRDYFRREAGVDPDILFPGAGGYWWRVHRDMISMAFKRSATDKFGNVKFSNSPGKESLPGYLRVYARGSTMIIGDVRENLDADPEVVCLFVKLVDNGVYVYNETFEEQAARAERTWGKYTDVVLSPMVAKTLGTYVEMRERERAAAAPLVQDILEQIRSGRAADLAERA